MKALIINISNNHIIRLIILLIPIVIFFMPILITGNKILMGDFDMQIQMTEAARQSILNFHQFPFWNPWVAGGVPLFADPQFGLFTIQTLLSFIFGSVMGWKLAIITYMCIGFISMRYFLLNLGSSPNELFATLVAYIWIFGSFFTMRSVAGHFTFLILAFLPLALHLSLNITKPRYVLYLGALATYCIYAALHYSTILILICSAMFLGFKIITELIIKLKNNRNNYNFRNEFFIYFKIIARFSLAITLALMLSLPRIYSTFAYIHDNSIDRSLEYEPFVGIARSISSVSCPFYYDKICANISKSKAAFSFFEGSSYIGLSTMILFTVMLVLFFRKKLVIKRRTIFLSLLTIAMVSYVIGLGGPVFSFTKVLPVFSSMRVSTRWFFIFSFSVSSLLYLMLASVKPKKIKISKLKLNLYPFILAVCLIEVLIFGLGLQRKYWLNNPSLIAVSKNSRLDTIKQDAFYSTQPSKLGNDQYLALTQATLDNHGQIIADNALVDTRIIPTLRCDQDDQGCGYIMSSNAALVSWSQNKIILERNAPGDIELNMNPGSGWKINGVSYFKHLDVVDSKARFIIPAGVSSNKIELTYNPF